MNEQPAVIWKIDFDRRSLNQHEAGRIAVRVVPEFEAGRGDASRAARHCRTRFHFGPRGEIACYSCFELITSNYRMSHARQEFGKTNPMELVAIGIVGVVLIDENGGGAGGTVRHQLI